MSDDLNKEALERAQARVRESAEKFGPLGRPADSSCACTKWPCACQCHKDRSRKAKPDEPTPSNVTLENE